MGMRVLGFWSGFIAVTKSIYWKYVTVNGVLQKAGRSDVMALAEIGDGLTHGLHLGS